MSNPGAATTTTSAYVGGGSPVFVGAVSTASVGFYGATPVVQPTTSLEAAAISTAAVSISATQWGFTSSAQANSIIALVNQLRADLVTLGLIKGS